MFAARKLIKAERWWNDKAPPVLGLAYFLLAAGDAGVPLGRSVLAMGAFMTSFVGVAGFGHVVNDLCDVETDAAVGKANSMQRRTAAQSLAILLVLLVLAWLPWLALPADRWNLSLVGLQLLLLTVYAAPPLRFKARAVPGVVTDALYAYTVPALITWTTFGRLAGEPRTRTLLLASLVPWSLCAGLKGILSHQLQDAENDVRSGLATFATRYGRPATLRALTRVVIPVEAACFVSMTVAFSLELPLYGLGVVLFIGLRTFQVRYLWDAALGLPWHLPPERAIQLYGFEFLGKFYRSWFPLFMLAALSVRWPAYIALAAAHLVLFDNGLVELIRDDLRHIPAGIAKMVRRHG